MNYRTRIAPSPTGWLHIGTARTALFNFLFTKKNNGTLVLRIDDTDQERSTKQFEDNIIEGLDWLKIKYDEFYRQSERVEIYRKYLKDLIDKDLAYISQEAIIKESDRSEVIRFRNPNKKITFKDIIRGEITFDTTDLGDFVIAKDLNSPLYHLASVIDDKELNITHIIRGEDHISNTPRQILIALAIGAPIPYYAHIPLILAPDKSKLSKRHGAVSMTEYKTEGYLPEAMINFIATLGWSPQTTGINQDILNLDEIIDNFKLEDIQKSGAVFNIDKLKWLNRQYINQLTEKEIWTEINLKLPNTNNFNDIQEKYFTAMIMERINTWHDIKHLEEQGELDYIFNQPIVTEVLIKNKNHFDTLIDILETIPETEFIPDNIKEKIWDYATEQGRGEVLWPMRTALTGKEKSPDPFTVSAILGKKETISRLQKAKMV